MSDTIAGDAQPGGGTATTPAWGFWKTAVVAAVAAGATWYAVKGRRAGLTFQILKPKK